MVYFWCVLGGSVPSAAQVQHEVRAQIRTVFFKFQYLDLATRLGEH